MTTLILESSRNDIARFSLVYPSFIKTVLSTTHVVLPAGMVTASSVRFAKSLFYIMTLCINVFPYFACYVL